MTQHVVFLLLGLSAGAVYAALALGLVVTFRSSGVINFATGSIALLAAYMYADLRQGQLLSLIPGTPQTYSLGGSLGLWPAMLITLVACGALGLGLYLVVFRPLRNAPPVGKAVASLGISVVITSLILARFGVTGPAVQPIYPQDSWKIGNAHVSADRVYLAATIVAVAIVLSLVFRYTRFGMATRAAAESEKGAYVSGVNPDRVAAYNWILSSAVAGLAGVLISPIVPLAPVSYTLFIVPALAAATVGQFQYLGQAVAAGLVIGMLQSDGQYLQSKYPHVLPQSGVPELIPLIVVLVVLVIRAKPLPSRGAVVLSTLGRAPRPHRLTLSTAISVGVGIVAIFALQGAWREGLILSFIYGVIALSSVAVTGYAGQVSLAQLPLAGVAAFLVGPLARHSLPFPIAPLVAALAATLLGVIVGLPALRIRGLSVAVVTLALAYALQAVWFQNLDFVSSSGVNVPDPKIFGVNLGIGGGASYPRAVFGIFCLVVLAVVAVGVAKLRTSKLGYQMLAVRANERSAAAAGINVVRVKLVAFGLASFIAGLGGCLLAYKQGNVDFQAFTAIGGLSLFATIYLAGITSVSGGVLAGLIASGGLLFVAVDKWLSTGAWYDVISGVGVVITVIFNPEGLVGPAHDVLEKRRNRSAGRVSTVMGGEVLVATPGAPTMSRSDAPTALKVEKVSVHYGGVKAVDDVTFDVPEGRIVGLIGPNGAGKTTLIDALTGFTPSNGTVTLGGQDLSGLKPFQRTRAGLARTFQAIELYDDLSVEENVVVGLTGSTGRDGSEPQQPLEDVFKLLGLTEVRHRPTGELSQGQRQLVSIARSLATHPKVLLLDEPAGGLDTRESHWLGARLRAIRDSGVTILMIDHDMSLVLGLCDEIQVLNFGAVIASGTPGHVRADPRVAEAYLGSTHAEAEVSA
jgi:ABC-type branched-subunit amino acid transport system ATPase component/branched-subunit amino acid ABC-type transport system permease component